MASGPFTMISVRLGSRMSSAIGLSSVEVSGIRPAAGTGGARIMGQVLRIALLWVSAEWTAPDGRSGALLRHGAGNVAVEVLDRVSHHDQDDQDDNHDQCHDQRIFDQRLTLAVPPKKSPRPHALSMSLEGYETAYRDTLPSTLDRTVMGL